MASRDLVVVGGSAGGLEALLQVVAGIARDTPVSMLVAIHRDPHTPGALPQILTRASLMRASYACDGDELRHGHIHVAPPDHHLLVSGDRLRVTRGPTEHGFRPAIDPLFRTAAREHGPRVVGVVLSGSLDDGTLGLALVKRHGGTAIVQRVEDALMPGMPASAIHNVTVDHVLPAQDIGPLLVRLSREPVAALRSPEASARDPVERGTADLRKGRLRGRPTSLTCPDCGGGLRESRIARQSRLHCHVGHAFTPRTLAAAKDKDLDIALWTAIRSLEESALLRRRLAGKARDGGLVGMAEAYDRLAAQSEERATTIRRLLTEPSIWDQSENGGAEALESAGELTNGSSKQK